MQFNITSSCWASSVNNCLIFGLQIYSYCLFIHSINISFSQTWNTADPIPFFLSESEPAGIELQERQQIIMFLFNTAFVELKQRKKRGWLASQSRSTCSGFLRSQNGTAIFFMFTCGRKMANESFKKKNSFLPFLTLSLFAERIIYSAFSSLIIWMSCQEM